MSYHKKKVSEEVLETLDNLRSEIGANGSLNSSPTSNAFNTGIKVALEFIDKYKKGEGLLQCCNDKLPDDPEWEGFEEDE